MLNLETTQKSIQCHGTGAWGTRITFVPTEITDPRSEHVLLPWCLSPGWHDRPDFLRSRESDKGVMSQDRVSSPQYLSGNLTIGVSAQWSPLTSTPPPTFPLQGKSWVNTFLQAQGPSPPPPPPALTYWGELLPLDILGEGRIKVLRIALIEAVDAPFFFDLHIPVHQNELSNGLWNRRKVERWGRLLQAYRRGSQIGLGIRGGSRPEVTPVLQYMLQYKELGFCVFNWGVIDITLC